jgi:hypothetical protein
MSINEVSPRKVITLVVLLNIPVTDHNRLANNRLSNVVIRDDRLSFHPSISSAKKDTDIQENDKRGSRPTTDCVKALVQVVACASSEV